MALHSFATKDAYTFGPQTGTTLAFPGVIVPPPPTITSFTPASGPVASEVTVTGTNFINVSAVRFGQVAAVFTAQSATSLKATVPAGATTAPLSVTTPGGTATSSSSYAVSGGGFNYPAPLITNEDDTNDTINFMVAPPAVPANYAWDLGPGTIVRSLLRVQSPNNNWQSYVGAVAGHVRLFRVKADGMTPDSPYAVSTIAYTANRQSQANVTGVDSHSVRFGFRRLDLSQGDNQSTDLAIQVLTGDANLLNRGGDGITIMQANEPGNLNYLAQYRAGVGTTLGVYIFDFTTNARRKLATSSADVITAAKEHIQQVLAAGYNYVIPITSTTFQDVAGTDNGATPTETQAQYLAACDAWARNSAVQNDGAFSVCLMPWYFNAPDSWRLAQYYGLLSDRLHATPLGSLLQACYVVAKLNEVQNTALNDTLSQVTISYPAPDQVRFVANSASPAEISLDATASDPHWWPLDLLDVPDGNYPNARVRLPADPNQQVPVAVTIASGFEPETQASARAARLRLALPVSVSNAATDPLMKALKASGRLADVVAAHYHTTGITPREASYDDPTSAAVWSPLLGPAATSDFETNGTRYRGMTYEPTGVNVAGGAVYAVNLDSYELLVKIQHQGQGAFRTPVGVVGVGQAAVYVAEAPSGYHLHYRDAAGNVTYSTDTLPSPAAGPLTLHLHVSSAGMRLRLVGLSGQLTTTTTIAARQIRLGGGPAFDGGYELSNELFSGSLLLNAATPWTDAALDTLAAAL